MVTIRPETVDDIPAVAALHVRAWQSGYAGVIPAEVLAGLDPEQRAEQRRKWHGAAGFLTLVATDGPATDGPATDGPAIAGFATGGPAIAGFTTIGPYRNQQDRADIDPTVGELLAIYVEPARIGTGVGRALLSAALDELSRRGYQEVRLWVLDANERSRRFYEKAGFVEDGERAAYPVTLPSSGEPVLLPELRYARGLPVAS